jgi:hypothetical protein
MSTLGPLELPVLRHGVLGLTTHQTRPTRTPPADRTRPGLGTPPPNLERGAAVGQRPVGAQQPAQAQQLPHHLHVAVRQRVPYGRRSVSDGPAGAASGCEASSAVTASTWPPGEAQSCHRGPRCCRRPPPPRRHPAACSAAAVVTSCFQAGSLIAGWPHATCGAAQLAAAARQAAQF